MSKTMYIVLGILAILVILVLSGKKSVHHEISIQASPEKVWEVLVNTDDYPSWNPVMMLLEGEVKEGSKIKYLYTQDAENSSEIGATVIRVDSNKLLNQKGGIPLVLTFDHTYSLHPEGNSTRVIIHEDYSGIGVNFWNPEPVGEAYGRLNTALKKRVENP